MIFTSELGTKPSYLTHPLPTNSTTTHKGKVSEAWGAQKEEGRKDWQASGDREKREDTKCKKKVNKR